MILFLILMITFSECLCLRTSDLCKLNSDSTNCYESFENKCNQDYCTINKQACDDFLSLMIYVNLTESLKIKRQHLPANHTSIAMTLSNMGLVYGIFLN